MIERRVGAGAAVLLAGARICLAVSSRTPLARMLLGILRDYPQRALLGLVLMAAQAFFYNAIFFSYALVLTRFYAVPSASVGWYILPFALGNFLGPLLLGPLFDTLGRKPMIGATYALSGILLAIVGYLFREGLLDAAQLTASWTGHLLFRLGSREFRLSDRQRELSARSEGTRDCSILRARHRDRRRGVALAVRHIGRHRRARRGFRRLPPRRGSDDRGSDHGIRNRRQG